MKERVDAMLASAANSDTPIAAETRKSRAGRGSVGSSSARTASSAASGAPVE
jgi:hypothetical protein